jgi:hypothetical protein
MQERRWQGAVEEVAGRNRRVGEVQERRWRQQQEQASLDSRPSLLAESPSLLPGYACLLTSRHVVSRRPPACRPLAVRDLARAPVTSPCQQIAARQLISTQLGCSSVPIARPSSGHGMLSCHVCRQHGPRVPIGYRLASRTPPGST